MVTEFQDLVSLVHLETNRSGSASRTDNKTPYRPRRLGYFDNGDRLPDCHALASASWTLR